MTTPAPSFAAISRVVFQPWSVRTTVSVFCFKSAISASCLPGLTFSRLIKITDSSDMAYLPSVSDTPRTTRRVETDRDEEDFLERALMMLAAHAPAAQLSSCEHVSLNDVPGARGRSLSPPVRPTAALRRGSPADRPGRRGRSLSSRGG